MKDHLAFIALAGAMAFSAGLLIAATTCALTARPAPVIERHYHTAPSCFDLQPFELQPFEVPQ